MNIGVLTSNCLGGAGIAARRIHGALLSVGEGSWLYYKFGSGTDIFASTQIDTDGVHFDLLDRYAYEFDRSNRPSGGAILSLPYPPIDNHFIDIYMREREILNMNWVSGLMSPENMAYAVSQGKRLVWTLHDENPFTAVCHYRDGCLGYMDGCQACPQVAAENRGLVRSMFDAKLKMYPKEMTIVAPSRWLADEAAASMLLSGRRVEVIPNAVNTALFDPNLRVEARRRLGIAEGDRVVLCGAVTFSERRKGWDYLKTALESLHAIPAIGPLIAEDKIKLLSFGEVPEDGMPFPHIALGSSDDAKYIAGAYAAADVAVIPSLEDNLPNTMLEALSCGTPVVGFAAGGMPDTIKDGVTGYVVEKKDVLSLAARIADTLLGAIDRGACRAYAEERFSYKRLGEAYRELFRDILKTPQHIKQFGFPSVSPEGRAVFLGSYKEIIDSQYKLSIYDKSVIPALVRLIKRQGDIKVIMYGMNCPNVERRRVFAEVIGGIAYFIDDDTSLQGAMEDGVEIKPPEALLAEKRGGFVVLVWDAEPLPVVSELVSLGVSENDIIVCS